MSMVTKCSLTYMNILLVKPVFVTGFMLLYLACQYTPYKVLSLVVSLYLDSLELSSNDGVVKVLLIESAINPHLQWIKIQEICYFV